MKKHLRGLFPFVKKEKYYNNPTKVRIDSILGENRIKRIMFLLDDNGEYFVTDFKKEVFYELKSWFGNDIKNWINKNFILVADKWTSNTYTLRVLRAMKDKQTSKSTKVQK